MASKVNWSSLMRGRPVKVVPTAILGFLGVIGSSNRSWMLILASVCVGATVLLEIINYRWERSKSNRLGRSYEIVLGRVLNLIADLSDLTARQFDLWVVDLYLPQRSSIFSQTYVRKLELSLHIALTDVRLVRNKIKLDHEFFGRCFTERRSELWWDVMLAPSSEKNRWEGLDRSDNEQIRTEYGVISVNPVVDNLGGDCCGLLVVHAMRDAEVVTKVLGALTHSEGQRRMAAACVDIHNYLQTS